MKKTQKGFTLIELLVVIAIIGILASVVLVNLNDARDKGTDAKVKTTLSNVRSAAEIAADGGSYDNVCANTQVVSMLASIDGEACVDSDANSEGWAVYAPLPGVSDANADTWCVDSTGAAVAVAANGTSITCN